MTDEERQKLCTKLRDGSYLTWNDKCAAADEIERLTEELRITNKALSMCSDECNKVYERYDKKLDELERLTALAQSDAEPDVSDIPEVSAEWFKKARLVMPQSDAEPVAWRWRYKGPWPWTFIDDRFSVQRLASHNEIEVEPLYTAPPRPDASAGLIEVAEMAEEYASKYCYDSQAEQGLLRNFAQFLRSRAADRSRKP